MLFKTGMWEAEIELLNAGDIQKISILSHSRPLRFADIIGAWQSDEAFRGYFNQLLADADFPAFFWELPPLTRSTLDRNFECVLVNSPALAGVVPDTGAFGEYFADLEDAACVAGFNNLGKDAWLLAPAPLGTAAAYAHLAVFVRQAPAHQQQVLWQALGTALSDKLSDLPLWLSTSGLGVYWLHVRLDSFPKYYTYHPYTRVE